MCRERASVICYLTWDAGLWRGLLFFSPTFLHFLFPVFHSPICCFVGTKTQGSFEKLKSVFAMICLILMSQWKWHRDQSTNHVEQYYAASLLCGLGSKPWPPSESSSVSWDAFLWHLNCIFTEAEGKETEQDQSGPLLSWLEKPATNMKAAWGRLDIAPRPIYSRWSFPH